MCTARTLTALLVISSACAGERPPAPLPPSTIAPALSASAAPEVAATASAAPAAVVPPAAPPPAQLSFRPLALPGATGTAFLDYIVYEGGRSRVWVPVASTGSVDVLDVASGNFTRVDGFKTEEREVKGKKRTFGPSAATVGDGYVYVGNRATSEVCPIDVKTLKAAKCLKLPSATDGVAYAASTKEVWVTTPKDQSLTVLDASKPGTLKVKTAVKVDGAPEGYAVDEVHGLFFTNLEDKGGTVVVDMKTHKAKATWPSGCGADGPRGLAFDATHNFVIVACTDGVRVLDGAHDGAHLGTLETGAGVDNIDYVDGKQLVYVGAAKAAKLTIARVDAKGQLTIVAVGATSDGARNAVADANGNAYVADSASSRLLVFAYDP